ncbi:Cysteine desulfurase [Beutenbergia cavernae DSM 12333]|uniref:Cysteine desulfurase n=1 Tax=Beutenbergia cavernae (strain ATCC BAA-8 / DSM 12333 / CCUG 43141 / JCM 11478 / NBRC 16432 / NCIMB 13614 / HKI 0122) TaxID=471853 RepID=C5BX96_BEUC1|nr:aminotransferase class V-fold PLP-dependent enzyme [Beutenbergia cavernae]ACQ78771.1 Cysteine desulfurase [Beutenbergia cavernae DSM 12333]
MSTSPLAPIVGLDSRVPIVTPDTSAGAGAAPRTVRYANLDYAASAPALAAVAEAVTRALPLYASVHRGAGYLSQVSTALYEASRTAIGTFVGARTDDVVVITRNTTDALNLLAGCVPEGGTVLVLDLEHHANLLPWQRSAGGADVLALRPTVAETLRTLTSALATRNYTLLAVTGASNVTGEALPIDDVVELAHAAGVRVVVDGAQLLPHRAFSLASSGADYVTLSGHKLYAPYGAGALVGRRDWLDAGRPYLAGGGAVTNVTASSTTWEPAPQRHEGGSPNVIGALALGVAARELTAIGDDALRAHDAELRTRLVAGLEELDGVRTVALWSDSAEAVGEPVGVVTFALPGHDPGLVAAYLSAEHGVGVRDGRFCAHPLLSRLDLDAGALRASIGLGTTADDVDRLLAGVRAYLDEGPGAEYVVVNGRWQPAADQRVLPEAVSLLAALGADATAPAVLATAAAGVGCGPAPEPATHAATHALASTPA